MDPFPPESVPATRMAPSVSSPSLLAREPRAPQSQSKRLPRPFLLRSTTPLKPTQPTEDAKVRDARSEERQARLPRSKTDSALSPPPLHSTSSKEPCSPPAEPSSSRRSSRPLTTSTRTLPVRASRKITFVPDPTPSSNPPHAAPTRRTSTPASNSSRPPASTTSVAKVQAVEKRKMELKRETLLSRATGASTDSRIANENDRNWSLRPVRALAGPRRTTSYSSLQAPPDSPTPLPQTRRIDPAAPPSAKSPLAGRSSIRGPLLPHSIEPPTSSSSAATTLRKKESYGGLSRSPHMSITGDEPKGSGSEEDSEMGNRTMPRSKTGYTSLQEILAENGYRDTRVVTPNSKCRTKEAESRGSLAPPPRPEVKEKSSMLSLRGLFSLWGSGTETEGGQTIEQDLEEGAEGDNVGGLPSPSGSGGTFTHSPISRAREWVEGVAIATAQEMERSPTPADPTSFTPEFHYSLSTTEDSPASSRSYSSSIVTASSIRSPPQVTIALPSSTVAFSPPVFDRFPSTLSPPKSNAIKSLRHVVSDSTLPQRLPHYTSFPFSPSSLESSSSTTSSFRPLPRTAEHLLSPYTSPSFALSPPLSSQVDSAQSSSWIPSALRHRASQVFSLPVVGLGLTSTAPLFPRQPHGYISPSGLSRSRNGSTKGGGESAKRKPKLLRKAVSSAGLVRPVLTTTNY